MAVQVAEAEEEGGTIPAPDSSDGCPARMMAVAAHHRSSCYRAPVMLARCSCMNRSESRIDRIE